MRDRLGRGSAPESFTTRAVEGTDHVVDIEPREIAAFALSQFLCESGPTDLSNVLYSGTDCKCVLISLQPRCACLQKPQSLHARTRRLQKLF